MSDQGIQLRCDCAKQPLLAVCGRDKQTGEPWVHVKSWKGQRLYTEIVVLSGVVRMRCRECSRWMTLRIVKGAPQLKEFEGHPLDHL